MHDFLVGRETESVALDRAMDAVEFGLNAVLVTGEAGIGKSALTQELLNRAATRGGLVLTCTGHPTSGVPLPFAPVAQVLRHLRSRHRALLEEVAGPQTRRTLSALIPDFLTDDRCRPGVALEREGDDSGVPGLARERLLTAIAGVLLDLGARSDVVLRVDDLQWVDPATLDLLELVLRNGVDARLLLLLVLREPVADESLRRWAARHVAGGLLARLEVTRLDREQTADLLASLGERPSAVRAAAIHRVSGGNPFRIRELARVAEGEMPRAVRDVVLADVSRLSPAARRVVAVLAVAGRPLDHPLLAEVTGSDAARAAAEAVAPGIVVLDGDRYAFGHDLARRSVLESLPPGERLDLHSQLFDALSRGERTDRSSSGVGEIAWHAHEAGLWEASLGWSARAAEAAEAVGAFSTTHRLLAQALDAVDHLPVDGGRRLDLLERAATAADRVGATEQALAFVSSALDLVDLTQEAARASRLLGRRAWLHFVIDEVPPGVADAERAVDLLPSDAEPAVRAEVLMRLQLIRSLSGRVVEARGLAQQVLDEARAAGDERFVGRAILGLANLRAADPADDNAVAMFRQAWDRAVAAAEPDDAAEVVVSGTAWTLEAGRYEDTVSLWSEGRQALGLLAEGRHWLEEMADNNAAVALTALGRWDEAETVLGEALAVETLGTERLAICRLRIAQGRLAEADSFLPALALLRRDDAPFTGLSAEYGEVVAELRLWQQRPDEALDLLQSVVDGLGADHVERQAPGLFALGARAAADLVIDQRYRRSPGPKRDLTLPRAFAEEARTRTRGHPVLRAVVEAETSRADEPDPSAWETVAKGWDERLPLCGAYARFRLAESLLDCGRAPSEAAPVLRAAAALSDSLGSTVLSRPIADLARRARIDLTVSTRPAPGEAPLVEGLTPREVDVLRLLAEGLTNPEIGRRLYLSPKSVSVHVSRMLQKLGVRSRVQLAAAAQHLGLGDELPRRPPQTSGER